MVVNAKATLLDDIELIIANHVANERPYIDAAGSILARLTLPPNSGGLGLKLIAEHDVCILKTPREAQAWWDDLPVISNINHLTRP